MGSPTTIYRLLEVRPAGSSLRYVLLCLHREGFSNVRQHEETEAHERVIANESQLLAKHSLSVEQCILLGELQGQAAGDDLTDVVDGMNLRIWYASTRYGHPWVVLGTGSTEEEFWREVDETDDLRILEPVRPAKCVEAYCLVQARGT